MDLIFNNSIVNWVNDVFYTKTEVDAINTSVTNALNTKLNLAGGTMTGNLTLDSATTYITNGTPNTAYIRHNGTGWQISG